MKGRSRIYISVLLILIILSALIYFCLSFYYRDVYSYNTWINGVYCTGLSVDEVSDRLLKDEEVPYIILTDTDGKSFLFDLHKYDYRVDYRSGLEAILAQQNSIFWLIDSLNNDGEKIEPEIYYDSDKLKKDFEELPFYRKESSRDGQVAIGKNSNGLYLHNDLNNRIDLELTYSLFYEALSSGRKTIDLGLLPVLYDITPDEDQSNVLRDWMNLEAFISCDIVYDMGDESIALDPSIMSNFVKMEEGSVLRGDNVYGVVIDEDAVASFVDELCLEYNTYGIDREFKATRGETVIVPGEKSTYGTTIDHDAEISFLMDNLLSPLCHDGVEDDHIPTYLVEPRHRGKNDLGGTYIEVDMTDQKMYYYVDDELTLQCDIVTGNARLKRDTPQGFFYVYFMQRNRTLRGADYESFVKYWMAIKDHVGLHDASWRNKFGGEIYKTNGSHGCINLPTETAKELYSLIDKGTPAVVFY